MIRTKLGDIEFELETAEDLAVFLRVMRQRVPTEPLVIDKVLPTSKLLNSDLPKPLAEVLPELAQKFTDTDDKPIAKTKRQSGAKVYQSSKGDWVAKTISAVGNDVYQYFQTEQEASACLARSRLREVAHAPTVAEIKERVNAKLPDPPVKEKGHRPSQRVGLKPSQFVDKHSPRSPPVTLFSLARDIIEIEQPDTGLVLYCYKRGSQGEHHHEYCWPKKDCDFDSVIKARCECGEELELLEMNETLEKNSEALTPRATTMA